MFSIFVWSSVREGLEPRRVRRSWVTDEVTGTKERTAMAKRDARAARAELRRRRLRVEGSGLWAGARRDDLRPPIAGVRQ